MSGFIYFIWARGYSSGVKIGYAADVMRRARALQCQTGIPLVIIGQIPGTKADELAIHERFKACRLHGEWFHTSIELNTFMYKTLRLPYVCYDARNKESSKAATGRGRLPKVTYITTRKEEGGIVVYREI